ncbi:MAG TPA: cellulose biosynthesis protein BcsS [Stellaceae bacterium]|jgi:hypothetical protein|nr:cellulose biosynthesis protein BcsS [Stellaceae bacterium]
MKHIRLGFGCLVAAAFCVAAAAPALADDAAAGAPTSPWSAIWAGGAFKNHVSAAFAGGVFAANGTLDSDGLLFRGEYTYVGYDFTSALSSSGSAHGTLNRANAEVGYQLVRYGINSSLFVGPDYQDFNTTPSAAGNGKLSDKLGAMFVGRVARTDSPQIPASLEGNYSTANSTYWSKAKVGINFGQITVGPEIALLGNAAFDEARYGGYSAFTVVPGIILQGSLGYSQRLRSSSQISSSEGAYVDVSIILLNY